MSFAVPVVDVSAYVRDGSPGERAAVAAALDEACRTVGFIQVVGHGVPAAVADGLAGAMDAFFAQPLEVKNAWRTPPEVNRGYSPPKSESLSLSLGVEAATRMNDFFEAFNVGASQASYPHAPGLPQPDYAENTWPDVAGFRPAVEAWSAEAGRVARTLTRVFADALGLAPDFFARITDHSLDVLRMNNYALPEGTVRLDGDLTGMGEHTDYGIVTVLWADQVAGLQVLGTDGGWHDVVPADGALLVNLGDVTARLTNERWMSTLHRVKPPIIDGTIQRRRSAAFFHDGDVEAVVAPLPECLAPGEEPRYLPVTIGEHIAAKLRGSRAGVVNTAADREAARVLAARR
ncbi:isopenicillin N synthase family dioxygenase [Modestobacter versicolor]|uniref:Isopenicillin N synthase family oxygenase n=1 Tax=Modestobacter versicolor TaxID=429133 RepID=A0A323V933_9ACTN|nr:2-oxoglutarate and iron-dependent oxygenase domain-containing protein [Modestobacter versicolor]MBB3677180.1 isopenicillin N synthase-like dioxygenase [Modestobacter versicolor]PZA20503.1 isopenicillin N synthase family oxygenase [Modestobacter versicolor]